MSNDDKMPGTEPRKVNISDLRFNLTEYLREPQTVVVMKRDQPFATVTIEHIKSKQVRS